MPEGAKHVADAIATNTTLKELEYALSTQPCSALLLIRFDNFCFLHAKLHATSSFHEP